MTQFEVGKTYSCRSICDYECIWSFTVISRTGKTVVVREEGKAEFQEGIASKTRRCEIPRPDESGRPDF